MKKITLMTVMSLIMAACGSESTDIPGTGPGNNGTIENPSVDKVNPTLDDIVTLNKTIADAFNGKPTASQADLEEYMGKYSYAGCTYKNNKYHIKFNDGTQSVLDLNGYHSGSKSVSKAASRSTAEAASRTEQADTLLTNSKVLFWEPFPGGTTLYEGLGTLFEDYVGADNVTVISGGDCTWQSLMGISEYATVIINGLGFNDEWVVTGQEYIKEFDHSSLLEYISIYSAIVDGSLKHYYMVNRNFVSKLITPLNDKAILFNASPDGFGKGQLADAFKNAGYSTYIGFDNMPNQEWTLSKASQLFTAMLVDRLSVGQAADDTFLQTEEIQVEGISAPVQVACKVKGETTVYYPYTGMTDLMVIKTLSDTYGNTFDIETLQQESRISFGWDGRIIILDLSGMELSGTLSSRFSQLTELVMLDLSNNQLTGTIPDALSSLVMLSGLDMSGNQLTGNIPASFVTYYDKQIFVDFSENQLSGQIPFGKLSDSNTLFVFDHRYTYFDDGKVFDNQTGLWYADEPVN